jgi:BirA family biotin operon repressor/biotin-[acetyl-CoA-carboxylase] ligase
MTFGTPRFDYEKVGSTQDIAREMARAGAMPGTVVVAAAMKAGRGRRGRAWHVPPGGNVTLTAIGAPIAPEQLWQLTFVTGVAAFEALQIVAPEAGAQLRFPNDLQLRGRKLGGILIEAVLQGGRATPLIGVGINIAAREWPVELQGRAIALAEAGSSATVAEAEAALLAMLTAEWALWEAEGFATTVRRWAERRNPDALREFIREGQPVRCRVLSLGIDGEVELEDESGSRWSARAPEVVLGDG